MIHISFKEKLAVQFYGDILWNVEFIDFNFSYF